MKLFSALPIALLLALFNFVPPDTGGPDQTWGTGTRVIDPIETLVQ